MNRITLSAITALALVAGASFHTPRAADAQSTPVTPNPVQFYSNTFESGLGTGWSSNATVNADATSSFSRFLGRYSLNQSVTLSLGLPSAAQTYNVSGGLPANAVSTDTNTNGGGTTPTYKTVYRLAFDFYAIDSWDGLSPTNGQDWFDVSMNNTRLFNHAFAQDTSMPSWTTYTGTRTVGPAQLGFNSAWPDSIFRNVAFDFTLPSGTSTLNVRFSSFGLTSLNDESWGIDNVKLTYQVVQVIPTPGTATLLGIGGAMLARRRRTA